MDGISEQAVAIRLQAAREAFDLDTQRKFADVCGTTPNVVNNWLNGYNYPPVEKMANLCERTGLTLDWIYRGSMATMDPKLGLHLSTVIRNLDRAKG